MGKRSSRKAREHIPKELHSPLTKSDCDLPMNEAEIHKNDEVAIAVREAIGIAKTKPDEWGNVWVECSSEKGATGFYHMSLLFHTDEVTRRVRSKKTKEKKINKASFQTESLEDVEKGDKILLSTGDTVTVQKTSSRQVRAGGLKFVRSSGDGWGSQDITAKPASSSQSSTRVCKSLDDIDVGSTVKISNGEYEQVTKVSARQIRTDNYKFKRSDGTGWSDQKESLNLDND